MVDGLLRGQHTRGRGYWLSGTKVAVPARVCPAGHLKPYAVNTPETVGGRPHVDLEPPTAVQLLLPLARRDAKQPVADVDGFATRVNVAQPPEEVGVLQAGSRVQLQTHRANDLYLPLERGRGVHQHVGA